MIKRARSLGSGLKEITGAVSIRAKTRRLPVELVVELIDTKRKKLLDIVDSALSKDKQLAELKAGLLHNSDSTNTGTRTG